ncbi:MAG: C40 family peptidase [Candidatus Marinimicrobia bacterium]|nr:C40 family peptidase [Candidatus Neomarinimicrobiota bacterium]
MAQKMITNVSIANIYKEAKYGSETISQTYMAENLEVLSKQGEWLFVRQEDGYEGWVTRGSVVEKPANWENYDFFYPNNPVAWIYQDPERQSSTVRDITILSGLPVLERKDGWVRVLLPDSTQGWVEDNPRHPVNSVEVEALINTAFRFLGIQYSWGGKSPKGFDCSGFTQTCFRLNGKQLPRDAYLQADLGVQLSNDFDSWQAGDLIYFSEHKERITHVGISLGGGDFIHSSGFVKINSMNPAHAELFDEKYSKIFAKTMRLL